MDKKETKGFVKALVFWLILILLIGSSVAYVSNPDISDILGFRFGNITIGQDNITGPTWVNTINANITSSLIAKMGRSATVTVAASNSNQTVKNQADYVCDGVDDQVEIQAAIGNAKKILLHEGLFNISGFTLNNYACLEGVGPSTILNFTDNIIIGSYCTFGNLQITGGNRATSGAIRIEGASSHIYIHDVLANSVNTYAAFLINPSDYQTTRDIKIERCSAINCGGSGFKIDCPTLNLGIARDITFQNCIADTCGTEGYDVSFLITERAKLINVNLIGCTAINSWESGFHMETTSIVEGCQLSNCISNGSGRKPSPDFGSGFFVNCANLDNCYASGSAKYGYYIRGSTTLTNCMSVNSTLSGVYGDVSLGYHAQGALGSPKVIGCTLLDCNGGITFMQTCGRAEVMGNYIRNSTADGISLFGGKSMAISNTVLNSSGGSGIYLQYADYNIINDNTIENSGTHGIYILNSGNNLVDSNVINGSSQLSNNIYSGIYFYGNSISNSIINNVIKKGGGANQQRFGIQIATGCNNNVIKNNDLIDSGAEALIANSGTNTVIRSNLGYITENSGTATIASGNTFTNITHGLATTPSVDDIQVTPTNSLGSATKYWIPAANITSTTFSINVDQNPGATTATFAWKAEIL